MSIQVDENFTKEIFIDKLKSFGKDGRKFIPIVRFSFKPYAQECFMELNRKFRSREGAQAYDRQKLYLAMSYSSTFDIDHDLTKVARLCRTDKILNELFPKNKPCSVTFDNFLTESDAHIMKRLSVCTLMELNDLEFLDFSKMFTDSSESLINGSVHYKVSQKEIDGFKLMNELNLLHNRSYKQMKKKLKELLKIRDKIRNREKIELIDHILKNFKLYDKKVYEKLDVLEEYLEKDPESYVCIMFPESKFMRSKRGKYEFALLVQETMLKHGIILNSLVQSEPNDSSALEDIIQDLEDTFKILLDLQTQYGERENYKEIYDALKYAIHVLDSGYFTNDNLETAHFYKMNVLIMPKSIARHNNDKLRERLPDDPEKIMEKFKKITLREMDRGYNCYTCPYNHESRLYEIVDINSEYNRIREDMDDDCKEKRHKFVTDCPNDCPLKGMCDKEEFEIRCTPLVHQMLNKFSLKKYLRIYAERFGANEQIFAYLKRNKGMLKLAGSNKKATQNHLYIKMSTYNVNRKVELKGTID